MNLYTTEMIGILGQLKSTSIEIEISRTVQKDMLV